MIELIISVALIGVLATLIAPEVGPLRDRAGKVVCMGHLRSLHCSLGAYLNDNEQWPQCPEDLEPKAEEQFWFDALADYGAPESVWQCPTLMGRFRSDVDAPSSDLPRMHYTPTNFDDNPITPRKWPLMPWLIEISDVHHGGNLMIRTDGSVVNADEGMAEAKANGG